MSIPGTGFSNLHRILRSPDGAEGSGSVIESDNEAMAGALEVLNKKGLGMELEEPSAEERAKGEAKSREQRKVDEWKDEEEEEEEGTEGKEGNPKSQNPNPKQTDKSQKEQKEEEQGPSAEEIAEATQEWQERIAELEGKIAKGDEDGKIAADLAVAKENLQAWEEAATEPAKAGTPNVEEMKAELSKVQEEKAELEEKVRELEGKAAPGVSVQNVHPLFLADKAEEIERVDGELAQFEKWGMQHWDGVEEKTDGEGKVTQRGYTKEEVRGRLQEVSELRRRLIPAARESLELRARGEAEARKIYPELFDGKRPESKSARAIVQAAPVLKAIFPANLWVVIGDALAGEKMRLEKAAKKGKTGAAAGGGARRPLPRVARGGGGGSGTGGGTGGKEEKRKLVRANGGIDPVKFMEGGGDRKALIAAIS